MAAFSFILSAGRGSSASGSKNIGSFGPGSLPNLRRNLSNCFWSASAICLLTGNEVDFLNRSLFLLLSRFFFDIAALLPLSMIGCRSDLLHSSIHIDRQELLCLDGQIIVHCNAGIATTEVKVWRRHGHRRFSQQPTDPGYTVRFTKPSRGESAWLRFVCFIGVGGHSFVWQRCLLCQA